MTYFMHIQTEERFWSHYVKPLAEKHALYWGVLADYDRNTVFLKLTSPADMKRVEKVDVDRAYQSEKIIKENIDKAILKMVNIK